MIDALGPARPAGALLRVRSFPPWAAGTLASGSVAVPRPCCRTGPCGPTDMLRQGVRILLADRAVGSGQARPLAQISGRHRDCADGPKASAVFCCSPRTP